QKVGPSKSFGGKDAHQLHDKRNELFVGALVFGLADPLLAHDLLGNELGHTFAKTSAKFSLEGSNTRVPDTGPAVVLLKSVLVHQTGEWMCKQMNRFVQSKLEPRIRSATRWRKHVDRAGCPIDSSAHDLVAVRSESIAQVLGYFA